MYINTHTYYSLRYGAFSPETLLQLAVKNGFSSLVLTDINTTSACIEFVKKAKEYKVKSIIGVDFRNGVKQQFILIAKNNEGFQNINIYLTEILHNGLRVPDTAPELEDVIVIYPFKKGVERQLKESEYLGIAAVDLPYVRLKILDANRAVILQTVSFRTETDFNAHRLLRAIDNNILLSKLPVTEQGLPEHKMFPKKGPFMAYFTRCR